MNKEEVMKIVGTKGCMYPKLTCPPISCDACRAGRILALAQTLEKPEKKTLKYPDDFKPFHGVLCNDRDVNRLIEDVLEGYDEDDADYNNWGATANILLMVTSGYIEVYQKVAEAEIK